MSSLPRFQVKEISICKLAVNFAQETSVCKLAVNFLPFRDTYRTGLAIKIKFYLHHLQRCRGQFRADLHFKYQYSNNNNNSYLMSTYQVPESVSKMQEAFSNLILIITSVVGAIWSHFREGKTGFPGGVNLPKVTEIFENRRDNKLV